MTLERQLLFKILNYLILNRSKNYFIELMYREFKEEIEETLKTKP